MSTINYFSPDIRGMQQIRQHRPARQEALLLHWNKISMFHMS
jgi:hypothetical protein